MHYVRLTPLRPENPTGSKVGLWNQHRSGCPLGQWPTRPPSLNPPLVTTSLQCCVNFIGCRYRDEWNLRLRVSYTNRFACFNAPTHLSADILLISKHGRPHLRSSSHRTLVVTRTSTSLQDRSFAVARTAPVEHFAVHVTTDDQLYGQFRRHLKAHLFRA